jgi:hypothetical protein
MTLASNPYAKAELDNLQLQFGTKAMLDMDDYCALFGCGREKATRHMKRRGVPSVKVGQAVYIPIQDLALFLARKKAEQEGRIVIAPASKEALKSRGFAKNVHDAQLAGGRT